MFLLTLAIVDDIGAILVIAIFYAGSINFVWLAAAAGVVVAVVCLRRGNIVLPATYVVLGVALWLFVYESGVHATIAGVVMGLLTPAVAFQNQLETGAIVDSLENQPDLGAEEVRRVSFLIRASVPLTDRLLTLLHPWTSYVIVPLFALANAGIEIRGDRISSSGAVTAGVLVGLVIGKTVGVAGAAWLATRLGIARLPAGVTWIQLVGAAALAGIGFTVSLFVAGLAFDAGAVEDEAKIAILVASAIAAATGSMVLVLASRRANPATESAVGRYHVRS